MSALPRKEIYESSAIVLLLGCASAWAQSADSIIGALSDRALAEQVANLKTDDRIAMYSAIVIQSQRTGPAIPRITRSACVGLHTEVARDHRLSYLDHAVSILSSVLFADSSNYEALRLLTETQLERHLFATAVESSRRLIQISEADPWNWGLWGTRMSRWVSMKKARRRIRKWFPPARSCQLQPRGSFSFSLQRRAGRHRDHEKSDRGGELFTRERGLVHGGSGEHLLQERPGCLGSTGLHGCSADLQELSSGVCRTGARARGKRGREGRDRKLPPRSGNHSASGLRRGTIRPL